MGSGLSTTLGKSSLHDENKAILDGVLHHLRADDLTDPHLDLANAYIGDEGLRLGSMSLASNSVVTSLDLSSNGITPAGLPHLLSALERRQETVYQYQSHDGMPIVPPFLSLNLSGNPELGDAGAALVAKFLARQPQLEELSLYHCGITDQGLHHIVNALLQGENRTLAVLRLDMNHITDAGLEMLLQLVTAQREDDAQYPEENEHGEPTYLGKGLGHVTLTQNPGPFSASLLAELKEMATPGREALMLRHQAIASMEQMRLQQIADAEAEARRASEAAERQAEEARREAAERDAAEAEEARQLREAQEQQQKQFNGSHGSAGRGTMLKGHNNNNLSAMSRDAQREVHEAQLQKTIDAAYEWRNRMTGHGTLVKEWRDGFTVMRTKQGDIPGTVPSLVPEAPRRLKACWCDPHDVSAPFAKTLHYHCKFESAAGQQQQQQHASTTNSKHGGGDAGSGYHACRATGHICATVGFYAKPLPDRSAAHFFASQHPASNPS